MTHLSLVVTLEDGQFRAVIINHDTSLNKEERQEFREITTDIARIQNIARQFTELCDRRQRALTLQHCKECSHTLPFHREGCSHG